MNRNTLSDLEFSDVELKTIDNALKMLEETFAGKLIQCRTEEDPMWAQHSNEIEHWNSIACDVAGPGETLPPFASMIQWAKDEKVREQLNPRVTRLKTLARQVIYTNRVVLQRCWVSSNQH